MCSWIKLSKIKNIKKNVDVLTLSATPIPRTLNLALSNNGTVNDVKGELNLQKNMLQNHSEIMNSVISSQEEEWGISD